MAHHTETIYAITDLSWGELRADQLAETIRGHWGTENQLHWIRDVVFAEDHSQIRSAPEPDPPTASSRYSYNGQINFAEALVCSGLRAHAVAHVLAI